MGPETPPPRLELPIPLTSSQMYLTQLVEALVELGHEADKEDLDEAWMLLIHGDSVIFTVADDAITAHVEPRQSGESLYDPGDMSWTHDVDMTQDPYEEAMEIVSSLGGADHEHYIPRTPPPKLTSLEALQVEATQAGTTPAGMMLGDE